MSVYSFTSYLSLQEKAEKHASESYQNSLGVFHELETARHLNHGKIPEKHDSASGESPAETHARHAKVIERHSGKAGLKAAHERAASAAEHLRHHYAKHHPDHVIHKVHWTSKPGDVTRTVGKHIAPEHTTQTQERADIIVELRPRKKRHLKENADAPEGTRFSAVSLKTYTKSMGKTTQGANAGIGGAGPRGKDIAAAHRKKVERVAPTLGKMKSPEDRKQYLRDNPAKRAAIEPHKDATLRDLAKATHEHFKGMNPHHKSNWLKKNVLGASKSPLHAHPDGHESIRLKTDTLKTGFRHKIDSPSSEHDYLDHDPEGITSEHHGRSVKFHHRGKHIGTMTWKTNSDSDPLSSLKSVGLAHH